MSYYRLAQTIEKLSYVNSSYTWEEALYYYIKAYENRPCRAEPIVRIALYYIVHNDIDKADFFIKQALSIPYPYNEVLFVEKDIYDFLRLFSHANC